jgi:phage terminase large subunit
MQLDLQLPDIHIPKRLLPIFEEADYKILYGGRSSGKSATVARYLTISIFNVTNSNFICARQNKVSLRLSTYSDIKNVIYQYELQKYFDIKRENIVCTYSNSAIEFVGLEQGGVYNLKSVSNIAKIFVEEAEKVTEESWEVLIPTVVRNAGSEIILAFNPKLKDSATYERFITNQHQLTGKVISIEQNYPDNPYLTQKGLAEIESLRIHNYPKYEHIYLGKVIDMTEDVIFKGHFKVDDIHIDYHPSGFWHIGNQRIQMMYGMDFGFSVDPFAAVEFCYLDKDTIYITREICELKLLPSKIKLRINQIMPEAIGKKWYADCARPDTIAELKQEGLNCEGADKNKGSVEAGIEYLLGKNIIINHRCSNTIYEFSNYRYKTDKNTGNILTDIIDANNHIIDSLRYGDCKNIQASRRQLSTESMQNYLRTQNYGT